MMTATDGDGGPVAVDVAGTTSVVAAIVTTSVAVGSAAAAAIVTTNTSTTTTTTTAATTALSFSTVAFSVPLAMHLSRYGRLPSWNKSRTQCLVIFHSTIETILAMAICCKFLFRYFHFKYKK